MEKHVKPSALQSKTSGGPTSQDDHDVIALIRQGRQEALSLLYERHQQQVNATVWKILGADSEHDDLVQQVFMRVIHNISKLRDGHSVKAWIMTITVNTVREELRRRRVRRILSFDTEAVEMHLGPTSDPEMRHTASQFYKALDRLSANQRIAFVMHHFEGYTLAEVAESCSCSISTVQRRIQRAKAHVEAHAKRDPVLSQWLSQREAS